MTWFWWAIIIYCAIWVQDDWWGDGKEARDRKMYEMIKKKRKYND